MTVTDWIRDAAQEIANDSDREIDWEWVEEVIRKHAQAARDARCNAMIAIGEALTRDALKLDFDDTSDAISRSMENPQ